MTTTGESKIQGFRLSPQQRRLWSLHPAGEEGISRARCVVRLSPAPDPARLSEALARLTARHEVLRTVFHRLPGMGEPLQVILERAAPAIRRVEVPAGADGVATLLAAPPAPLDLEEGPVLDARLADDGGDALLALELPALCADPPALDALVAELASAYGGRPADEEPIQYVDVAEVFNEVQEDEHAAAAREVWSRVGAAADDRVPPPLDVRPAGETFAAGSVRRRLGADAADALDRLPGGAEGGLLAAWATLLARLGGRAAAAVSVAFDGRTHEGLANALGSFRRYLPLRLPVAPETPFRDAADATRRALDEVMPWQDYFAPGGGAEGGEAGDPDAVGFAFERAPGTAEGGGVRFETVERRVHAERFLFELRAVRDEAGIEATLFYDRSRVDAESAELLAGRLAAAVESAAASPRRPLGDLDLLAAAERRELAAGLAPPAPGYRYERRLEELVEEQAARSPDRVAVTAGDRAVTYGALRAWVARLAERLESAGVGDETPVAVVAGRRPETLVALLAVLRAGGCYVPIDPSYPEARRRFVLEDSGARVLLSAAPGGGVGEVSVEPLVAAPGTAGRGAAGSEARAYVIYTSGSTGRPKGVCVPHRAIVNRLLWMQHEHPLDAGDRVLQKTALGFDASLWELLSPLLAGASVVLAGPGAERDPAAMVDEMVRERVTVLQLVPSMLGVFLEQPAVSELTALRRLFCGGEALPDDLVRRAGSRLDAEIVNLYGPTETAIDATWRRCPPHAPATGAAVPIGRPLAHVRVHLFDPRLQPVPKGVAGELAVAGAGVARGYLGRPGLTAERFVPDPFASEPGGRLYRTGDLSRLGGHGELEFLGRIDHQVKVRGLRIELGEIEAALRELPGVAEAAAAVRTGAGGQDRLVAYAVPEPGWVDAASLGLHRLPNGLEVVPLNRNEADFIYREVFEEQSYLRCGVTLSDGDRVFDVGANIGMFSLFAADRRRDLEIWAFEPVPAVHERLRANLELYGLDARAFRHALGARPGRVELTFYPRWSGMSGAHADPEADAAISRAYLDRQRAEVADIAAELLDGRFESETIECPVRTLSEVIREQGVDRIDLLKIDVERSELEVLEGVEESDWPKIRQVTLEAHDEEGRLARIVSLLEGRGFRVEVREDALLSGTGLYAVYAVREPRGASPAPDPPEEGSRLAGRHRALSEADLLAALGRRLPEAAVPGAVVFLDRMPRTANGKLDRAALPAPEVRGGASAAPPRTHAERVLAEIWREVLGIEAIGVHDNFFELGGDSILSIQVVTRANRAGLRLLPRYIFRHQTIAELAGAAESVSEDGPAEAGEEAAGPVPLTPIQLAFFEHVTVDVHHHDQAMLLGSRERVDGDRLERAVAALIRRHDALRLRFERAGDGWRQTVAGPEVAAGAFSRVDLAAVPDAGLATAVERSAAAIQAGFDLARAPLFRVVLYEPGGARTDRILFAAHHLVVDGVSWRILLEDLETLYRALGDGRPADLPPVPTSFSGWAAALPDRARELAAGEAAGFWLHERHAGAPPLPEDRDARAAPGTGAEARVAVTLGEPETRALLEDVPAAYGVRTDEALLAALGLAVARWTGEPRLRVDLEGHGREPWRDDLDPSRAVGWFTALYPVALDAGRDLRPGPVLKRVKEQVRPYADRRLEHGLLLHLAGGEVAARLRAQPRPEISFNYLGQQDRGAGGDSPFVPVVGAIGPSRSSRQARRYRLEIDGGVGGGRLRMVFTHHTEDLGAETVRRLAADFERALGAIVAHCRESRRRTYTPSDFPLAEIGQSALDRLAERIAEQGSEIEDLYPLSPLQQGLLFHALDAPGSGEYFVQWGCTLTGEIDADALRRAWARAAERHPPLRTSFAWEGTESQLQVVHRKAEPPWEELDWRDLPERETAERLESWLREDRRRGFDPGRAPLLRLALLRLGPARSRFVWSHHHLLLDGWCLPIVLREVFDLYSADLSGRDADLPPARPYREYIAWVAERDSSAAEAFWRRTLAGFTEATPLPPSSPSAPSVDGERHADRGLTFEEEPSRAVRELLRGGRITLNTLVQGAWGLLLGHHAGSDDVVYGATVSGRPPELPDVERMVGLFVNTLPVRVRLPGDRPALDWLRELQAQQAEARDHEHSPLARVQEWSEVPAGQPLFEAIMTFENYPVDPALGRDARGLVSAGEGEVVHSSRNSNPLTLLFGPGARLWARLLYDRRRFDERTIDGLLADLATVLTALARKPDATVGELREVVAERGRDRRSGEALGFAERAREGLRRARRRSVGGAADE